MQSAASTLLLRVITTKKVIAASLILSYLHSLYTTKRVEQRFSHSSGKAPREKICYLRESNSGLPRFRRESAPFPCLFFPAFPWTLSSFFFVLLSFPFWPSCSLPPPPCFFPPFSLPIAFSPPPIPPPPHRFPPPYCSPPPPQTPSLL